MDHNRPCFGLQTSMKARQGCWTCKRRKIGCDRTMPHCNNCMRTGRYCLGYGIYLAWPDKPDGRRKDQKSMTAPLPTIMPRRRGERSAKHFINFTTEDIIAARGQHIKSLPMQRRVAEPPRNLNFHTPLLGQDGFLLIYYKNIISVICSTTQARNGFCTDILPMALCSQDAAAIALCKAMLAISAYHLYGSQAAMPYKIEALRALSKSLACSATNSLSEHVDAQLAASLMLCMYSVFDAQEGNWHVHLKGVKRIMNSGPLYSEFLFYWAQYYQVLGAFTQPSRRSIDFVPDSTSQALSVDQSIIIGALGCSAEVFSIIQDINHMRDLLRDELQESEFRKVRDNGRVAETRLRNLAQRLDPDEEIAATSLKRSRIIATADLYRLAALLYAHRVSPAGEADVRRAEYLGKAYRVLSTLHVVSCPWPIFVLACESQGEEERVFMLEVLDRMSNMRAVGNIGVMRKIVEAFWKRNDLLQDIDRDSPSLEWWRFYDSDTAAPWFV